jgi:hypothetical protein
MHQPVLKKGKRYILYRWLVGIGFILCFSFFLLFLFSAVSASKLTFLFFLGAFICGTPLSVLCVSAIIFNLDYSVLGRFQRTPWPEDPPLETYRLVSAISRTWSDFMIFPSGLGINILLLGKVFIHREQMLSLVPASFSTLWRHELDHNSTEFISPIRFNNKELYLSLQAMMKTKPEKKAAGEV